MNTKEYRPLVSIALTTFNGGSLIKEQVDSILAQTYQNFEIVISDDGSDKETLDILNTYTAQDSRIRWSRSPLERGYRKNTENAISLCKGEIIFLCDQDDVWFSDKIESHVDAYRDPEVMWSFNRFVITDEDGKETGYIEDILPDYFRHKSMLENVWGSCIGAAQTSYRTSLLKKTLPIPSYCSAHDAWIQLAIYPAKPYFIKKVLNTYRQHAANQIGINTEDDIVSLQKREREAIADNYYRLKKYAQESHLPLWKRSFLIAVYILKKVRRYIRKMGGKTDAQII